MKRKSSLKSVKERHSDNILICRKKKGGKKRIIIKNKKEPKYNVTQ